MTETCMEQYPENMSLQEVIQSNYMAQIGDKKMSELLKISLYNSPRKILRRLKEIDKG